MDIERERGITIKAKSISLNFLYETDNLNYTFNLIDTPGHVDFYYEVSQSLLACEGAILLIDASQGIEAQTVALYNAAIEKGLKVIIAINKIDLPQIDIEKVKKEINQIININYNKIFLISAKKNIGIKNLLNNIIKIIPAPKTYNNINKENALIIDAWFDNYLGVILLIKIYHGFLFKNEEIRISPKLKKYKIQKIGILKPNYTKIEKNSLSAGEIGFLTAGIKNINDIIINSVIIKNCKNYKLQKFSNNKNINLTPQIYVGFFPLDSNRFSFFKNTIEKLHINDNSFSYIIENSRSLGLGFRMGFLGILHMEIVKERLEREYNINILVSFPSVKYLVFYKNKEKKYINNPDDLPSPALIKEIHEPIALMHIISPMKYLGKIMELCSSKRGKKIELKYINQQISIMYHIPMNEIITNFSSILKSYTNGYGSMSYKFIHYSNSSLEKVNILINKKIVNALSFIAHKKKTYLLSREIIKKLKDTLKREMFSITIQAAIGSKIILKEKINPYRKNVIDKCYGGDITRKRKLLEKQKLGKKKMKQIGSINISRKVFLSLLEINL